MSFFEFLERLKVSDISLILYSLLNRIPIIVYGDDAEDIDNLVIEISDLIHFTRILFLMLNIQI